jgi:hypothetical protein
MRHDHLLLIMVNPMSRNPIPFDLPATYQIVVLGQVDPLWSDRLEGMAICQDLAAAGKYITTLEGELSDQSALTGVLNTLYELHLTVLSVQRRTV